MRREYRILLSLFAIALMIRILFVFVSPVKLWDEAVYADLGYDLSKNPSDYSFARKWSDYVPGDWPKAGFRAPLLPYTLSIFYFLDLGFLVEFLMPLIGALSVLLIFVLAKKMFNEKVALYSAIFLLLLPLHVILSGKMLTDVFSTFFVILTVLFFWQGFEKGKVKYKLLFGMFLALSILARYTAIWILPVLPIYLIIKNRNLSFLKDKFLWLATGLFLITLLPWFIYGITNYGNPLGPFMHGFKATAYWGGVQPWYFFFQSSLLIFSILSIVFLGSLLFIVFNKNIRKNSAVIFLLLWFFIFFIIASIMSHKEDRFLLPIVPPLIVLSALFIDKMKKHSKIILVSVVILMIVHLAFLFYFSILFSYTQTNLCFLEANKFMSNLENDSLIITDESPRVYFYTKKENHFYPRPFELPILYDLINNYYRSRPVYILWSEFSMPLKNPMNKAVKNMLDSNFDDIYMCPDDGSSAVVYRYSEVT